MTRSATLAALSLSLLAACEPISPDPLPPGQDHLPELRLEEGSWRFEVSQVSVEGDCGVAQSGPEALRLPGSIFYTQGQRLEVEIEGLLLSGAQEGRTIFAEGGAWADIGVEEEPPSRGSSEPSTDEGEDDGDVEWCEEESDSCVGEPGAPMLSVYIDGIIDNPEAILGELVIEQDIPGGWCVVQARYTGAFVGDLPPEEPVGVYGDDEDVD